MHQVEASAFVNKGESMFAASGGGGAAVFVLILVVLVVMWWWSFIDALVKPSSAWTKIDRSRGAWVVLLLVFGILASFPYLFSIRPKLNAAKKS
jgi:preprotein translocase subunit YajC